MTTVTVKTDSAGKAYLNIENVDASAPPYFSHYLTSANNAFSASVQDGVLKVYFRDLDAVALSGVAQAMNNGINLSNNTTL